MASQCKWPSFQCKYIRIQENISELKKIYQKYNVRDKDKIIILALCNNSYSLSLLFIKGMIKKDRF